MSPKRQFSVVMNSELKSFDYHGSAPDTATAVYRCAAIPNAPLGDYWTIVLSQEADEPVRAVAGLVTIEAGGIAIPESFFDGPESEKKQRKTRRAEVTHG